MDKVKEVNEIMPYIKDGMSIMIGGFLGVGGPDKVIDEMIKKGVKDIKLISNDTAFPDVGIGKMIVSKMVSKVITSHIGTNPETGRQLNEGEIDVVLTPQGTLAEQIRAGGAGLGGVITPTGIGTIVEKGKQKIEIEGKMYIVEKPIRADVAIIRGEKVDKKGNIVYDKSARNFNPLMAMAADIVIVEADEIVDVGSIDPDHVMTPGIFVDMIVKGGA